MGEGRRGEDGRRVEKIHTSMKTIIKKQEMTKTTDFLESHPRFHYTVEL